MSIISKIASIFGRAPKAAPAVHRKYGPVTQIPKNDIFEYVGGLQPKIKKFAKKNGVKINLTLDKEQKITKRRYTDIISIEISKKRLFREPLVENATFYNQPPYFANHKPFETDLFKKLAEIIKILKKK